MCLYHYLHIKAYCCLVKSYKDKKLCHLYAVMVASRSQPLSPPISYAPKIVPKGDRISGTCTVDLRFSKVDTFSSHKRFFQFVVVKRLYIYGFSLISGILQTFLGYPTFLYVYKIEPTYITHAPIVPKGDDAIWNLHC